MIIDKLDKIEQYRIIPQHAIEFIKNLSANIALGRYQLTETDYVNVETYSTKPLEDAKFEAHNKYIDIQILVSGNEKIFYTDRNNLLENAPYCEERDIIFYKNSIKNSDFLTLNGTNFAMIFPHEAHAPQVSIESTSNHVKKVVLKIKI